MTVFLRETPSAIAAEYAPSVSSMLNPLQELARTPEEAAVSSGRMDSSMPFLMALRTNSGKSTALSVVVKNFSTQSQSAPETRMPNRLSWRS